MTATRTPRGEQRVDEVRDDALAHHVRGVGLNRHSVSHTKSILPHDVPRAGGCRSEVLWYSRRLRGRSSAAEHQLPKLRTRVRFPSPAPRRMRRSCASRSAFAAIGHSVWVVPKTRYARSGDVNVAYQVFGDGPIDLVFVPGFVSHVEMVWEEPHQARFLERLAAFCRVLLFDKRGTGMSDRVPIRELPTLEQRMDDVRAVMDAAGSERAALFGLSEGGAMCTLFAATYPERTTALIIFGGYARWIRDETFPWAPTRERHEELFGPMEEFWGLASPVAAPFAPSMNGDMEFAERAARHRSHGIESGCGSGVVPNEHRGRRPGRSVRDQCSDLDHAPLRRPALSHRTRSVPRRTHSRAKFVELAGDDHCRNSATATRYSTRSRSS